MSFPSPSVLDLRPVAPAERHPLVFSRLQALAAGDGLLLVNNHDPSPLQRQLHERFPGSFAVAYLEDGPEVWQLEIRKAVPAEAAGSCCSGGRCCG
ncbi:MAG: DUF2249 domain-containing protein [Rubrivivax sp.]